MNFKIKIKEIKCILTLIEIILLQQFLNYFKY